MVYLMKMKWSPLMLFHLRDANSYSVGISLTEAEARSLTKVSFEIEDVSAVTSQRMIQHLTFLIIISLILMVL